MSMDVPSSLDWQNSSSSAPKKMSSDGLNIFQRDMRALNVLATELLREVMGYLQGEELPVALTNTRLLRIARSIHEDRTLSAQRKSAYVSSGALTTFVLNHGMVEVDVELSVAVDVSGDVIAHCVLDSSGGPSEPIVVESPLFTMGT